MLRYCAHPKNAIIIENWIVAADSAITSFQNVMALHLPHLGLPQPSDQAVTSAELLLHRLDLTPDILTFEKLLDQSSLPNATMDGLLLACQYQGVIVQGVVAAAGMEIPESTLELFHELAAADTTFMPDHELRNEAIRKFFELFLEGYARTVKEAFLGVLWIYPAAVSKLIMLATDSQGTVLILCAIRSIVRYRFEGFAHYIIHGLWVVTGFALALLGLVDMGAPDLMSSNNPDAAAEGQLTMPANERKANILLGNNWLIAIVVIIYTAVNAVTLVRLCALAASITDSRSLARL